MLNLFRNVAANDSFGSTQSDLDHVRQRLLIERTALCPADLILVFGNRHILEEQAEHAAALYHLGYAPLIAASGGVIVDNVAAEAAIIKEKLLSLGVPDDRIITEDSSNNTQENVINTKTVVTSQFPNLDVKRVIGVGTVAAGRRFLMTLVKNWPEVRLPMVSNINPFATDVENWHTCPVFKEVALNEFKKLKPYEDNGWIQDINLGALNQRIEAASEVKKTCQFGLTRAN